MLANEQVSNTIFSALDLHVAIVDRDGVIVDVNDVWMRFAAENGGQGAPLGVGANYFDVCRHAASSCADAAKVLDGMLSVAGGAVPRFLYTYRCDSPTEVRWYVMTVLPRPLPDQGLIVAHQNNTEMQQTQTRYGELLNGVRALVWRAEAPTFHTTFASGKPRRSSTPRLGKERDWKPPFLCLTTDRQCRLQRQPASSLKAKRRLRSR